MLKGPQMDMWCTVTTQGSLCYLHKEPTSSKKHEQMYNLFLKLLKTYFLLLLTSHRPKVQFKEAWS